MAFDVAPFGGAPALEHWAFLWPYGLAALAFGYLLGSLSFGILIARLAGLGDLRTIGSGNIGATNVLRTGNKLAAFATLVGDGGKGAAAVLLARAFVSDDAALLAGLGAFLGHLYPFWLGFKGGKGVATLLGTLLALHWPVGGIACATWLAVALVSRYSSLSALVAALSAPVTFLVLHRPWEAALAGLLAILVFIKHAANIRRLRAGTEPRIGAAAAK